MLDISGANSLRRRRARLEQGEFVGGEFARGRNHFHSSHKLRLGRCYFGILLTCHVHQGNGPNSFLE